MERGLRELQTSYSCYAHFHIHIAFVMKLFKPFFFFLFFFMEITLDGFVHITDMYFSLRGLFHVPECTDFKTK